MGDGDVDCGGSVGSDDMYRGSAEPVCCYKTRVWTDFM